MIAGGELLDLLWGSETLFAARLEDDGTVVAANAALEAWAGYGLAGEPVVALVHAPQRPVLTSAIADAGDEWTRLQLGFELATPRPAEDRNVLLRRHGGEVLLVAEAAQAERERLVEQVLALNEDLISTQRTLTREQRELRRAQDRLRRLEAIMLGSLTRPELSSVLDTLVGVVLDVLGCAGVRVRLRDDRTRTLVPAAAAGSGAPVHRVPLLLDGERIGMLEVTEIAVADVPLLDAIAERAALAIGHSQLRVREREVAEALQRSVLPSALPELATVRLAGRYLPRTAGVGVGGDFYDAMLVGDALALAIGDVAGKGLRAASTTARLLGALRAYALEGTRPGELLTLLDRLIVEDGEEMATAQFFALVPGTGELVYANAGHPPALRLHASGAVSWLGDALSPPLGTGVDPRPEARTSLDPGDRLLLFTDGLVERRGEILDEGLDRLARGAAATAGVEALCHELVDATGARFEDDVAVLAVERLS